MINDFYRGRKVLITGHTGFKGTWMCEVLLNLGAEVYGYALKPPTEPSLFEICGMKNRIHSYEGDIRDMDIRTRLEEWAEDDTQQLCISLCDRECLMKQNQR